MHSRLTLITTAILGAALAVSLGVQLLIHELTKILTSPSWRRKQVAWWLLVGCELTALFDRIYYGGSGRIIATVYISLFFLAICGMADSYRLMLKDLSQLFGRLKVLGVETDDTGTPQQMP